MTRKKPESGRKLKTIPAVLKVGDWHGHGRVPASVVKKKGYKELKKEGIHIYPLGDADKDGVINKKDCKPFDRKKQGLVHDLISGTGKVAGYVGAEVVSGVKDIPKKSKEQFKITTEAEKKKEVQRAIEVEKKAIQTLQESKRLDAQLQTLQKENERLQREYKNRQKKLKRLK